MTGDGALAQVAGSLCIQSCGDLDRRCWDGAGDCLLGSASSSSASSCVVEPICSNDSDLEPALQMVRSDASHIVIGLVMPLRETAKEEGVYSNKRLTALADWVRHHIRDEELAASQLPTHVPSRKKPVSKPSLW